MLVSAIANVTHQDDFNDLIHFRFPPINMRGKSVAVRQIMLYAETGLFAPNYYTLATDLIDKSSANPLQELLAFGTGKRTSIIFHSPPMLYHYKSQGISLKDSVFKLHSVAPHTDCKITYVKVTLEII